MRDIEELEGETGQNASKVMCKVQGETRMPRAIARKMNGVQGKMGQYEMRGLRTIASKDGWEWAG